MLLTFALKFDIQFSHFRLELVYSSLLLKYVQPTFYIRKYSCNQMKIVTTYRNTQLFSAFL